MRMTWSSSAGTRGRPMRRSVACAAVRGWFEYFKHSLKSLFPPLDAWIRMRLRSILLRRNKKRGVGKGLCHYDWTNEYFAKLGLFTMTTARALAGQSPKGAH